MKKLHSEGVAEAAVIGEVVAEPRGRIRVVYDWNWNSFIL